MSSFSSLRGSLFPRACTLFEPQRPYTMIKEKNSHLPTKCNKTLSSTQEGSLTATKITRWQLGFSRNRSSMAAQTTGEQDAASRDSTRRRVRKCKNVCVAREAHAQPWWMPDSEKWPPGDLCLHPCRRWHNMETLKIGLIKEVKLHWTEEEEEILQNSKEKILSHPGSKCSDTMLIFGKI